MPDRPISQIDGWLKTHRPHYYDTLQQGVSEHDLASFEDEFGVTLPAPMRDLFSWRNGQADGHYDSLVDNWMFESLESLADRKRALDEMIGYDFEDPSWWRREWVPLVDNGGGDCLCVDLSLPGSGRVIYFRHDDADRPVAAPDVSAWLQDLSEAMVSGTYEVY